MCNLSDLIVEEGMKEGMKVGKREGKREVAINLIKIKMPFKQISEVTGIALNTIEKLANEISLKL